MGAGMVNPGKVAKPGSPFNPGLVYDAGFLDYLGFLCDEGPAIFANPAVTCANLADDGIPTTSQNLNYPSIGIAQLAGAETVTRTVTSVASKTVTFKASFTAPPGYDVSVNPATITLAPGESASYDVTFTNAGAPVGEWSFGDLTWSGSGYHVRSPIALKGVQLSTPAEVTRYRRRRYDELRREVRLHRRLHGGCTRSGPGDTERWCRAARPRPDALHRR